MSTTTGRPRPFLMGVFRTACNYCVRSKRGCSGGKPCEQCKKRGKSCVYAQRRMSGPRGRPTGRSHRSRSKSKAHRETRAEAFAASASAAAAAIAAGEDWSVASIPLGAHTASTQGWFEDERILPSKRGIAEVARAEGKDGQLALQLPHRSHHSMGHLSFASRSESTETMTESLVSSCSSDDSDYPSDGDGNHLTGDDDGGGMLWDMSDHGGGDSVNSIAQSSSADYQTSLALDAVSAGARPFYGSSDGIDGGMVGGVCLNGHLGESVATEESGKSLDHEEDRYSQPAPLIKASSSLSTILDNSFEDDNNSDEHNDDGSQWEKLPPLILAEESRGSRQVLPSTPLSSLCSISVPPSTHDRRMSASKSTSSISEAPWEVAQTTTSVATPLPVSPSTVSLSPRGTQPLKSAVSMDASRLRLGHSSYLTEHRLPQMSRQQSTELCGGEEEVFFFGHVTPEQEQEQRLQLQKQHQQKKQKQMQQCRHSKHQYSPDNLQLSPPGAFAWKDEKASIVNVNLIHGSPTMKMKKEPTLDTPPVQQESSTTVIPPFSGSSSAGVTDHAPAVPAFKCNNDPVVGASENLRTILTRHPSRQDSSFSSLASEEREREDPGDDMGPTAPGFSLDVSASNLLGATDSSIMMGLGRSMNVATGPDIYSEFIDLDCATMANMRTPLTREASLMRAMEAVGSEVVIGINSSCDPSVFLNMWQ